MWCNQDIILDNIKVSKKSDLFRSKFQHRYYCLAPRTCFQNSADFLQKMSKCSIDSSSSWQEGQFGESTILRRNSFSFVNTLRFKICIETLNFSPSKTMFGYLVIYFCLAVDGTCFFSKKSRKVAWKKYQELQRIKRGESNVSPRTQIVLRIYTELSRTKSGS